MSGEQKITRVLISSKSSDVRMLSGILLCGASDKCKFEGGIKRPCSNKRSLSRFVIAFPANGVVDIYGINGRDT